MDKGTIVAGAFAGLAGGVAYLVTMEGDLAITDNDADDLVLLGGLFARNRAKACQLGLLMHLGNSVVAGVVYGTVGRNLLPGADWVRGTTFATIENAVLYPLVLLEDSHPAIRDGRLARYWTWPSFMQGVVRHIAFGAVMGAVFERVRAEQSESCRR